MDYKNSTDEKVLSLADGLIGNLEYMIVIRKRLRISEANKEKLIVLMQECLDLLRELEEEQHNGL